MRVALPILCCAVLLLAGCDRGQKQAAQEQLPPVRRAPPPQNVGETPMNERVAVIGLLNKRNGIVQNLTMKPGQAFRVRDAIVRLRACETTAPWETPALTGAFVQLDVEQTNKQWKRVFSGWLYKESPSLNAVEHPVYDVWPKSCTMNWPGAPATVPGDASPGARGASSRSSAKKSGASANAGESAGNESAPAAVSSEPSAAASNRT